MTKTCPNCNTETLEELGTAGYSSDGVYHNRHDFRCSKCNQRFDVVDCDCEGICKANKQWHEKNTI